MELPTPTTDLARAALDLDRTGVAIVPDAIASQQVTALREALSRLAGAERAEGTAILEDGAAADGRYQPGPNQRVLALLDKDPAFAELAGHRVPLTLTERLFGNSYGYPPAVVADLGLGEVRLSSVTANIAAQGGVRMALHSDQGFVPAIPYPLVANALWPLVDVDHSNGATEVVPGSHLLPPSDLGNSEPVAVPAPAGSVILLDGRTMHRTGANATGEPRPLVLVTFCRPWVRPFDDDIARAASNPLPARPWFVYDQAVSPGG